MGQLGVPGVAMGLQLSPMRWAVGFLAGRRSIIWWAIGAAVGWLGIVAGGTALGLADVPTAQGIVSSLGMGLMMGSGAGVVVKDVVLPLARRHVFARAHDGAGDAGPVSPLRTVLSTQGGATRAAGA